MSLRTPGEPFFVKDEPHNPEYWDPQDMRSSGDKYDSRGRFIPYNHGTKDRPSYASDHQKWLEKMEREGRLPPKRWDLETTAPKQARDEDSTFCPYEHPGYAKV